MRGFMAVNGPKLKARRLYVLASTYKAGPNDGSAHHRVVENGRSLRQRADGRVLGAGGQ